MVRDPQARDRVSFSGGEHIAQWVRVGILVASIIGAAFKIGGDVRTNTQQAKANGRRIDRLIERINGRFGSMETDMNEVKQRLREIE